MKFNILKTKRGKLEDKLNKEITQTVGKISIDRILQHIDEYERANLATIEKLKKKKIVDTKKINGAIKQFLNAHPILTKELIGSLSKRIYGALLDINKKENWFKRLLKWINIK